MINVIQQRKIVNIDILSRAMDYICYLKKVVDVFSKKRDEIKMKINDCQVVNDFHSSYKEGNGFPMVKVDRMYSHVLITTNTLKEHMVLSKILIIIEQQDLQLITSSSFIVHDKVTHTFHCKVLTIFPLIIIVLIYHKDLLNKLSNMHCRYQRLGTITSKLEKKFGRWSRKCIFHLPMNFYFKLDVRTLTHDKKI